MTSVKEEDSGGDESPEEEGVGESNRPQVDVDELNGDESTSRSDSDEIEEIKDVDNVINARDNIDCSAETSNKVNEEASEGGEGPTAKSEDGDVTAEINVAINAIDVTREETASTDLRYAELEARCIALSANLHHYGIVIAVLVALLGIVVYIR